MLLRTGKAAPQAGAIPPVAFFPNRTKPPAISFTISARQGGVSCIIKRPVTGVNPNLFCFLTRLRFGGPAFLLASQTERRAREAAGRETWRLRSGPDRGSHHHWSGLGGGRQGRGLLTAAGRACLSVYIVRRFPRSMNNPARGLNRSSDRRSGRSKVAPPI